MPNIHLQGIGESAAKPASELNLGDSIMWNGGVRSKVISVRKAGKSVHTELSSNGKIYARRFLANRLVAVA